MAMDPIERKRRLLSGEVDSAEVQRRKIEAHKLARAAQPGARKALDPIEAKRQALLEKAAAKKARTAGWRAAMPAHLVVLVRPARAKAPAPVAAPAPAKETKGKRSGGLEDEITRRLADARRRLKGK